MQIRTWRNLAAGAAWAKRKGDPGGAPFTGTGRLATIGRRDTVAERRAT